MRVEVVEENGYRVVRVGDGGYGTERLSAHEAEKLAAELMAAAKRARLPKRKMLGDY